MVWYHMYDMIEYEDWTTIICSTNTFFSFSRSIQRRSTLCPTWSTIIFVRLSLDSLDVLNCVLSQWIRMKMNANEGWEARKLCMPGDYTVYWTWPSEFEYANQNWSHNRITLLMIGNDKRVVPEHESPWWWESLVSSSEHWSLCPSSLLCGKWQK